MNPQSIVDRLCHHHGIEAVLVNEQYRSRTELASEQVCSDVLKYARAIAHLSQTDVRVVVGTYTILAQYEGDATIVVAIPTGHAVAKSLRRMIRRAATSKRVRNAD